MGRRRAGEECTPNPRPFKDRPGYRDVIYWPGQKPIQVTGRTKRECVENYYETLEKVQKGEYRRKGEYIPNAVITFAEFFGEWIERKVNGRERKPITTSTACQYRSEFKTHIAPVLGNVKMQKLERGQIEKLLDQMWEAGIPAYTINYCLSIIKTVLKAAAKKGIINENPALYIDGVADKRKTEKERGKVSYLTNRQRITFLEAARDSWYFHLYRLVFATGLRIGEASALKRGDLDFFKGVIHVRRTVEKDEAGHFILGETTKTENGERDIPMNDGIRAILIEQLDFRKGLKGGEIGAGELVFINTQGGLARDGAASKFRDIVAKIREHDETFPKVSIHATRHTFGTAAGHNRVMDRTIKALMGHAKPKNDMTERYVGVMEEDMKEAMQKLNYLTELQDVTGDDEQPDNIRAM